MIDKIEELRYILNESLIVIIKKKGNAMDREKYARRLRELRGDKTQEKVAKDLNISQSSYAMYENGQRIPSDEKKIKLAEYYSTTVQDIFF